MTTVLIDAMNLSVGGGGVLLAYLIDELRQIASDRFRFRAIVGDKTRLQGDQIQVVPGCSPLGKTRQEILLDAIAQRKPDHLLCFGNVPPRNRLSGIRTTTYFHNAHLIRSIDRHRYSVKDRIRYALLARAISRWQHHSDSWIVQTNYIRNAFSDYYKISPERTKVIPFFDQARMARQCEIANKSIAQKDEAFIYVSDDRPHKNHSTLLKAWQLLAERDKRFPTLRLTISHQSRLNSKIEQVRAVGGKVENLGPLEHSRVLEETARCRYCIFPSFLETLGLGLVEGASLGCKVLAGQLPFTREILTPSIEFETFSASSIVESVRQALDQPLPDPKVHLEDQIGDLVEHLMA